MPPPKATFEHEPRRLRRRYLLMLLPVALIMFFGLRSSPFMQELPWLPRAIAAWADRHWVLRSFVGFFVLGLIWFPIVSRRVVHAVGLALFGTLLELAQLLIPMRIFDWKDIIASILGVAAAWLLVVALFSLRRLTVGRV